MVVRGRGDISNYLSRRRPTQLNCIFCKRTCSDGHDRRHRSRMTQMRHSNKSSAQLEGVIGFATGVRKAIARASYMRARPPAERPFGGSAFGKGFVTWQVANP